MKQILEATHFIEVYEKFNWLIHPIIVYNNPAFSLWTIFEKPIAIWKLKYK